MGKRSLVNTLFYFSIWFWIMWGSHAWFTWWIGGTGTIYRLVSMFLMVIAVFYQIQNRVKFERISRILLFVILYLGGLNISGFRGISSLFGTLIKLYPLLVVVSIPREEQCELFEYISKGIAFLLVPSLLVHFLLVLGVPFPTIPITRDGEYINYIFDLRAVYVFENQIIPRFMSVFLEPGYLGVLMAFLLFANKFEIKRWYNKVFLFSLLISFSLGGYVVFLLSYVLFLFANNRLNFASIAVSSLTVLIVVIAAQRINGGDNMFNNLIIERLVSSQDEKIIIGNNRFSEGTDYYYEQNHDKLLLGLGVETVQKITGGYDYNEGINGAGYKVYFLTYGILSAILMLFFYLLLGFSFTRYKKYAFCFLVIIMITFIFQAEITSPSWYYVYFFGCACCDT